MQKMYMATKERAEMCDEAFQEAREAWAVESKKKKAPCKLVRSVYRRRRRRRSSSTA